MKKAGKSKILIPIVIVFSLLFFLKGVSFGKEKVKLEYKYKKFIQEVSPIITPTEKKIFYKLKTNKERDEFIKLFWKQRDPTPLTPENEFKEEYYKRLEYVNRIFGSEEGKPGWATERGKFYLLLGPPKTIDRYDGMGRLYPTEVWFYSISPKYGVPANFNLVFYKPDWSNEYLLYSPNQDGPAALIGGYSGDKNDYYTAYQYIKAWAPGLAPMTISLIPTEKANEISTPPLSNITLIANIKNIPRKQIDEDYIRRYYELRPKVEIDYSLRYVKSKFIIFYSIEQNKKIGFVHMLLQPQRFSIERYNDRFYTKLGIIIKIYDKKSGREIISFNKDQFLEFNKRQIFELKRRKVNLGLKFPIIFDKELKILVFIKNYASQEYFVLERDLNIPDPQRKSFIIDGIVAFRYRKANTLNLKRPFQVEDIIITPSIGNEFYSGDSPYLILGVNSSNKGVDKVLVSIFDSKGKALIGKEIKNVKENELSYLIINLSQYIKDFGFHKVKVELLRGDISIDVKDFQPLLSPLKSPLKPFMIFPQFKELNIKDIYYYLALQYFKLKENKSAEKYVNNILLLDSGYLKAKLLKVEIFYSKGEIKKGLDLLNTLENINSDKYVFLKFFGNYKKGNNKEALKLGEILLKRGYLKVNFLNDLGTLYYLVGNKKKALEIFNKSLNINPSQKNIKEMVEKIMN